MHGCLRRAGLSLVFIAMGAVAAAAQSFPSKPIRLIISFPPGGSTDVVARTLQPHLQEKLGQPIVIENRPGAGGNIAIEAVVKSAPDGYTLGLAAAGALTVNPSLMDKMPFDPLKDLVPVTPLAEAPFILAAATNFAPRTLAEAVAAAKAKPGELSIGHGGNGTAMHLTAELFKQMAGVPLSTVPYRGSGPVTNDVLAGHIPLGITDIPAALSLIREGKVRALAVSSRKRAEQTPDVPTFQEAGVPDFEAVGWFGIVAPAGTPPDVIAKLNSAFVTVLEMPSVRDSILNVGATPAPMTPQAFAAFIKSETEKWSKLIKAAGIKGGT